MGVKCCIICQHCFEVWQIIKICTLHSKELLLFNQVAKRSSMDTDETSSQEFLDTMTLIFEISSSPIFIETMKSLHYGVPNFKRLMMNHAMCDTQLHHIFWSHAPKPN